MAEAHDDWLARTPEEALEPDLPIVDPHHHLWDREGWDRFLMPELRADTTSGHRIEGTVFVECGTGYRSDGPPELRPVGETEFVVQAGEVARRDGGPDIRGVVGTADLRLGAVLDAVLDAHVEAAGGRFRGIRDRVAHDPNGSPVGRDDPQPPAGLMLDPDFRRGVEALGRRGLVFDAWLYHPQLTELVDLARAVPGTTIVLDHVGGPLGVRAYKDKAEEVEAVWRAGMTAVAACPNVVVKVGGIGMPMYGSGWFRAERPPSSDEIVAAWGDRLRFVIDTFGPDRCMFESNFPVDRLSFSYVVLWNAFKKLSASYTPAERAALFHDTAVRTYAL